MKKVASIITVTTRVDFYNWLDTLPWRFSLDDKRQLAEKAKRSRTVLWSVKTGFKFW